jgi:phosphoserine phosphatase
MCKKELALFDLDGTLFCGNSTFDFIAFVKCGDLEYMAFKKRYKYMRFYNKLCRLLFRYDWYKKRSVRFLKGYRKEELEMWASRFYEEEMVHRRIEPIHIYLNALKDREHTHIGLMTATIEPVANKVAEGLGLHLSFYTKLSYENEVATGEYSEDLLTKKMKIFENHLQDHYEKVYFCSDNPQDVGLLKNVTVGLRVYGHC